MAVYYSDSLRTMTPTRRNKLRVIHLLILIKKDNRRIQRERKQAHAFIDMIRPYITVQITHEELKLLKDYRHGI